MNQKTDADANFIDQPCSTSLEYYGLSPLVLGIEVQQPGRLNERQLRSPPRFLQTAAGQLHKVLNLPFAYFRFSSKMHMLTLHFSSGRPEGQYTYGAFQEPSYGDLADLDENAVKDFQSQIADIIWQAYHVEWWFIVKERAYQRKRNTRWDGFESVALELGNFPGTVNAYRAWNAPQLLSPLLKISTKFGNGVAEICDLGKTLMVRRFFLRRCWSLVSNPD
jgi:hypothetical protein